jgi:hypothetical protein
MMMTVLTNQSNAESPVQTDEKSHSMCGKNNIDIVQSELPILAVR